MENAVTFTEGEAEQTEVEKGLEKVGDGKLGELQSGPARDV